MGTRTVYRIMDSDENLVATLYSNSSHTAEFPLDRFKVECSPERSRLGPSGLVQSLLSARYRTAWGNHRPGDRMFWLVPPAEALHGDREVLVTAAPKGTAEELAEHHCGPAPLWAITVTELRTRIPS